MGGVLSCLDGEEVTSQPLADPYSYNDVHINTPTESESVRTVRTISTIRNEAVTSPRYRYEESYGDGMRTNVPEYSNKRGEEVTSQPPADPYSYNDVHINTPTQSESVRTVHTISTIRNEAVTSPRYRYEESYGYGMRTNVPECSPNKRQKTKHQQQQTTSTTKLYKGVIENSGWYHFYEEFMFVTLDKLDCEYVKIKELFLNSTKRNLVSINSIERVQNPFLMGRYVIAKKEMQLYSSPEERFLFHGTQSSNISSICQNNFNWRLRGKTTGHRFGQGVSFSPISHYASFYCDKGMEKVMLVAKVLVGRSCIGDEDMKIPPYVDFQRKIRYDTSEKENGQVIVKYRDDEYYPAYKICFHVKPDFYKKR